MGRGPRFVGIAERLAKHLLRFSNNNTRLKTRFTAIGTVYSGHRKRSLRGCGLSAWHVGNEHLAKWEKAFSDGINLPRFLQINQLARRMDYLSMA